jgi:hypothetical protein
MKNFKITCLIFNAVTLPIIEVKVEYNIFDYSQSFVVDNTSFIDKFIFKKIVLVIPLSTYIRAHEL